MRSIRGLGACNFFRESLPQNLCTPFTALIKGSGSASDWMSNFVTLVGSFDAKYLSYLQSLKDVAGFQH